MFDHGTADVLRRVRAKKHREPPSCSCVTNCRDGCFSPRNRSVARGVVDLLARRDGVNLLLHQRGEHLSQTDGVDGACLSFDLLRMGMPEDEYSSIIGRRR
jgi:hypothetical protein